MTVKDLLEVLSVMETSQDVLISDDGVRCYDIQKVVSVRKITKDGEDDYVFISKDPN